MDLEGEYMTGAKLIDQASPAALDSLRRLPIKVEGSERRVILLPFVHAARQTLSGVISLVDGMNNEAVTQRLGDVMARFRSRHNAIEEYFEEHYQAACHELGRAPDHDMDRRRLIGAYCSLEYSIEAAALFNPSMVAHPAPRAGEDGGVRFVMSFRATGEGHLSSVVFQTGKIDGAHRVSFDRPGNFSSRARLSPDQYYVKHLFWRKLSEMVADAPAAGKVLERLPDQFTLRQLEDAIDAAQREGNGRAQPNGAYESMRWLAHSNYQLDLDPGADINDLIIFPTSENEVRGIEDLRLVQFTDDDGEQTYYGTYTAYNGQRVLSMLLTTADFRKIEIHTLNGACVQNKGMALFPRKINGHYAMCSRIDGRNIYLMFSDFIHFWESAQLLASPKHPWEYRLMGNCGSPLETEEGWLLLTHGVGPVRQYSIGAMLLDKDNPMRIRGRLRNPLLSPLSEEREGYVPNVVYSCGGMIHEDRLYIPYAMADSAASIATVEVEELLSQLLRDGP